VTYDDQRRGDRGAYERYLRGMDATMKQKVALTAAHLLCRGRVADMGMGSGAGSEALAALYPEMRVVGVDVDETMVALASERHRRPNLSFVVGDIAGPVFEEGSLDGVFDSSVLHHVTSFGGYEHAKAAHCLEVQARELVVHGVLIVRDFVDPGPGEVLLDLRTDDGDASEDPRTCATAQLFERFAREFRSLHARRGFAYERVQPDPRAGWRRYRVEHKHAIEFALRKDYRADWVAEAKEEYTYFTQAQFEALFARLGLRTLASTPLRTPWIVRHRFRDKIGVRDLTGSQLEWPATNYVIVGEKVAPGEGVRFREVGDTEASGFLEMTHWRRVETGEVRDLIRRPHATIDVLPWFEAHGDTFVLARMSYPRPILQSHSPFSVPLDGARPPAYVTEPLNVLQTDKPLGQTVEEALASVARIDSDSIHAFRAGATYYPSPGGIQEEVRSMLVQIEPLFVEEHIANTSGFSTSGRVRAIEAEQLLRAAQVGGLPDARLELNVYDLLLRRGRPIGPWISEPIELRETVRPSSTTTMALVDMRPARRAWKRATPAESRAFLDLRSVAFEELDAAGNVVAFGRLERVVPRTRSWNTAAVAPLRMHGGQVWLGLDDDDLPAAQCFHGNSEILVAPAWRLPADIATITPAREWLRARLEQEHGLTSGEFWDLGGHYHPSPGITPEVVYPMAVEVLREASGARPLAWVRLKDAVEHVEQLRDGHLRIVALRAAHALGLFGE
jgi:ubiquinone/menaquinone biosynthesis C-methylase UbiE